MKTYVHDGIEVKLTGRIAKRKLKKSEVEIVEIMPVDPELGNWKKWVAMITLYEVKEEEQK